MNNLKMARAGTQFSDGTYSISWGTGRVASEVIAVVPASRTSKLLDAINAGTVVETTDAVTTVPSAPAPLYFKYGAASAPSNGQVPVYNATNSRYEPGAAGGAQGPETTHIEGLTPANNDLLQRKAGFWENRTIAQVLVDLAAAGTTFQPLDADLTAIAALTTTSFGRSLLASVDAPTLLTALGGVSNPMTTGGDTIYGKVGGTTNYGLVSSGASASETGWGNSGYGAQGPLRGYAYSDGSDTSREARGAQALVGTTYVVDLGQARLIGQISIGTRDPGYYASSVKVESSPDNSTWTQLIAAQAIATNADALFSVTPTTARYWRLTALAAAGGGGFWMLDAVKFFDAQGGLPQRLAAGTNGTVYQMAAGLPAWVTQTRAVEFIIDGGGSAITTGIKGDIEVPFAWSNIASVRLVADQSGSIVVNVWKDTYANFPPTVSVKITASAPPTISTATKSQDSTLTGWTKTGAAGDILRFNVDSATTVTRVTVSLVLVA